MNQLYDIHIFTTFVKNSMAISLQKKKEIVEKVKSAVKEAKSLVFVNFHGLTVGAITQIRRDLKVIGIKYFVAKKTLISRALGESQVKGESPVLPGEVALVWGEDLVAPAREIYNFQKKNPENLKILGGIFDSSFMDQAAMMEIASIPTLNVLHGKFVNIINSPVQRFVIALNEVAKLRN